MKIVLLSQNGCQPCRIQKKFMESQGIEFTEINISDNPDKIEKYDITSTPVTILEEDGEEITRFNGFDQEKVLEFAEYL